MPINPALFRTREAKASTFERMQLQYFVNAKGQLEESPIMKDTQAIVDSAEYTKLSEIYDNFLLLEAEKYSTFTEGEDLVHVREGFESDLDKMRELDDIRDRYARENPEVADMSHSEVYQYITDKISKANEKIREHKEGKLPKPNEASKPNEAPKHEGGVNDAPRNEPKSE